MKYIRCIKDWLEDRVIDFLYAVYGLIYRTRLEDLQAEFAKRPTNTEIYYTICCAPEDEVLTKRQIETILRIH